MLLCAFLSNIFYLFDLKFVSISKMIFNSFSLIITTLKFRQEVNEEKRGEQNQEKCVVCYTYGYNPDNMGFLLTD